MKFERTKRHTNIGERSSLSVTLSRHLGRFVPTDDNDLYRFHIRKDSNPASCEKSGGDREYSTWSYREAIDRRLASMRKLFLISGPGIER